MISINKKRPKRIFCLFISKKNKFLQDYGYTDPIVFLTWKSDNRLDSCLCPCLSWSNQAPSAPKQKGTCPWLRNVQRRKLRRRKQPRRKLQRRRVERRKPPRRKLRRRKLQRRSELIRAAIRPLVCLEAFRIGLLFQVLDSPSNKETWQALAEHKKKAFPCGNAFFVFICMSLINLASLLQCADAVETNNNSSDHRSVLPLADQSVAHVGQSFVGQGFIRHGCDR